jgi:hypothetical protein
VAATAADKLLLNPFLDAAAYRLERGALPSATVRLHFVETTSTSSGEARTTEVVIDVASDWALVRSDRGTMLFDFVLMRRFVLDEEKGAFVALNHNGDVMFRVMERQHRIAVQKIAELAGATDIEDDACDTETELGIVLPRQPAGAGITRDGATSTAVCSGRTVGTLELGNAVAMPAALWPTLASVFAMHPILAAEGTTDGTAPQRIETTFRQLGRTMAWSWILSSIEDVTSAFPLTDDYENATQQWLTQATTEDIAALAKDAVNGTAAGGAPTFEDWDADLAKLAATDPAGATLAILPTVATFPDALDRCAADKSLAICGLIESLRTIAAEDTAVAALFAIAEAEQSGKGATAIAAMSAAQASPHANHPALGETFALALLRFGQDFQREAASRKLPADPRPLMHIALNAYPYNAAYWADFGDFHSQIFEFPTALLLYDVAFALPQPFGGTSNMIVRSKLAVVAKVRADFPLFYLAN